MLEPSKNRVYSGGVWERKTSLEKKLILTSVFLISVSGILAFLFFTQNSTCENSKDECTTKYCVKAANELLEFVDIKENPCDNFYRFVCGSYQKHAVKKSSPSPLVTIKNEFQNELKSILVDPIKKKDGNSNILVKKFYQECMNETKIEADANRAFVRAIDAIGGWPLLNQSWNDETNYSWIDTYVKSIRLGVPVLGFFSFKRVETTGGSSVLHIEGPSAESHISLFKFNYNEVMEKIIKNLGGTKFSSEENIDVFNFINKLKEIQNQKNLKNELKGILKYLLAFNNDGKEAVKTVEDLLQTCPTIPWLNILNSLRGNHSENIFDEKSEVAFSPLLKSYCNSLDKLINSTKPRTLANFFVWSILHQNFQFLSRSLRKSYEEINYKSIPRYQLCFNEADTRFKFVKEAVYTRKKTSGIVKNQLTEMLNLTIDTLIEHLETCTWMDESTKATAIRKAQNIESVIGGVEEINDVEMFDKILGLDNFNFKSDNLFEMVQQTNIRDDKHFWKNLNSENNKDWSSFFKSAMKVNAFFIQPMNAMIIPAPILSSIFYDHRMPAFMNYGSLGRIIGHELMHGFEKSGRETLLPNGNFLDWWSKNTVKMYDKTVECAIRQYESIDFRYKLNGTLTLDENVSDFVGMDVAYEAYKKYIKKHGVEKRIPGVQLSPEQMFWVQTGTWLCFRKLDDDETDYEEEDEHAIPKFRVEGGARNSRYFAEDFNCPEGSYMNPKEKCRIL